MKKVRFVVVLICAFACAVGLSSCGDPVTKGYGLGISQFYSYPNAIVDYDKVEAYLNSKGCPTEGEERVLLIVDYSIEKCDKQAAAKFNELVKNLSREEVANLGLSKDCRFTYSCSRQASPDAERVFVGTWSYPEE